MVRGDQSLAPTLDDALAVTRLVDQLQKRRREDRAAVPARRHDESGTRPIDPGSGAS
jgi:hypothetical protein